ncbi:hypothetical protein [Micromonospora tulbaghiae]
MGDARRAVPSDADELVRLRGLMLADPAMRLTFPPEQSFIPLRETGNDL